jgi:transglutaminase-like putative cysteine protease
MKFDLPSASSIHHARSSAPKPRRRGKRLVIRFASIIILVAGAATGGFLVYQRLSRPMIDRIEIDGVVPTSSSYLSWSDTQISVRLPIAVDSGMIYVVTRHGSSNPKLYLNRDRLPVTAAGERSGRSGPFVSSLSAEAGAIGSLLAILGLDFGANRETSTVVFSWNVESTSTTSADQSIPNSVSPSELDLAYELWSDKEIRVRVPDGAASGAVYVQTAKGKSNGTFFRVAESPGVKRYADRRSYALSQSIAITRVRASGQNELYLWAPRPAESASQRLARILTQDPPPFLPEYRGTSLYRFKDLAAAKDQSVSQAFLVQVYAVEVEVESSRVVAKPADGGDAMKAYLAADQWVPADAQEVKDLVRKVGGVERNPWRYSRLVWDWLIKNVAWNPERELARPQDAISRKSADSWSYALLACALLRAGGVPSIPVAGYIVDARRNAARHYWVEVYLYGLGWVPMDPVLGAGALPGGIEAAWDDRNRYFGGLDNRHVAFSRGVKILAPMTPAGRRAAKERRWSFQSFYEEASGALEGYTSYWGDIELTGMY